MKHHVVVIHGGDSFLTHAAYLADLRTAEMEIDRYRAGARRDWKSSLHEKLGKGFDVFLPSMPNKDNAQYNEWALWFKKIIPHLNNNVTLVGHSLGALFLVKYLSENKFPKKIRATLLVATPYDAVGTFTRPKTLIRLGQQAGTVIFYQSKNDPVVSMREALGYQKELPDVRMRMFKKRGHFDRPSFPELARDIKAAYQQ